MNGLLSPNLKVSKDPRYPILTSTRYWWICLSTVRIFAGLGVICGTFYV
jgi:hypothetical protein